MFKILIYFANYIHKVSGGNGYTRITIPTVIVHAFTKEMLPIIDIVYWSEIIDIVYLWKT